MSGIIKLSVWQKKTMLAVYLVSFPLGLFAYGMGYRDLIVALSGACFIAALAVSESQGELATIFLMSLMGALSEMVNVGAGRWSYTPKGGFVDMQQIMMLSYVWGIFMWTGYNLAKLAVGRKNLLAEVTAVIAGLLLFSLTRPNFFFDPSTIVIVVVTLIPWFLFYRTSNGFEKAFLLFATFLGFYNEVSGILARVWFWESTNGTNILTLVGGSIAYAIPMWLMMKAGVLVGNAKPKYE